MDPLTHETAIFFGLSGTGKTTLSADPNRKLIGDDEHGWCDKEFSTLKVGAMQMYQSQRESEPEIYHAIKFGSVVENVTLNPKNKKFNYEDPSITPNARVGYPIHYIPNAELAGCSWNTKGSLFS